MRKIQFYKYKTTPSIKPSPSLCPSIHPSIAPCKTIVFNAEEKPSITSTTVQITNEGGAKSPPNMHMHVQTPPPKQQDERKRGQNPPLPYMHAYQAFLLPSVRVIKMLVYQEAQRKEKKKKRKRHASCPAMLPNLHHHHIGSLYSLSPICPQAPPVREEKGDQYVPL